MALTERSGSQILRSFLPEQTADIGGRIYRVKEWTAAVPINIDGHLVRQQLLREIAPWSSRGMDNGMAADLLRGARVDVVELDEQRGVTVEAFPRVWKCRNCKRIGKPNAVGRRCPCGKDEWGQLHFLGVHECGAVYEPWIKRCPRHDDVRMVSPLSAKVQDIVFECPECHVETMRGLGFRSCDCGGGQVRWNVHKARMIYAPRGMVVINPPRPEHMNELNLHGGPRKALVWVVDGLVVNSPRDVTAPLTRDDLIEELVRKGIDRTFAEKMAAQAEEAGQLAQPGGLAVDRLPADRREEAEREAVSIAMALAESRQPASALRTSDPNDVLSQRYRMSYPAAMRRAGIDGVDLVDRFPVLNAMYGYTRGEDDPAKCTLIPFRRRHGGYRLYGSLAETEAFFIRLDPTRVARWLARRGHTLREWSDPVDARIAIIEAADIPDRRDEVPERATVGSDLLQLVHTYAHRFIRQTAVFSGIERDALSEYLVPLHLGFFVYAAPRGEFVLGGLQAVFESELDSLLTNFVHAEHRCPLDPGCSRGSGACAACVHLGEPSCRYFNRFLNRETLFGVTGYLRDTTL
jgi:hypothetical protein